MKEEIMHIIVDGYNVLKQALASKMISDSQRRAFINMLGKYGQKKNHHIIVVFDGGPDVWPSQEKDHGILVAYSGIKQSADDLIKKALLQKPQVLLVTSDNELKAAAKQGTMVMDSIEFYVLVKQELAHKEKPVKGTLHKTSAEENPLVDELMRKDSQAIYKGDTESGQERRSKGQTPSKKERAYLQKLKKL
jgi:predicted RNA-binding protein with PIN domain